MESNVANPLLSLSHAQAHLVAPNQEHHDKGSDFFAQLCEEKYEEASATATGELSASQRKRAALC